MSNPTKKISIKHFAFLLVILIVLFIFLMEFNRDPLPILESKEGVKTSNYPAFSPNDSNVNNAQENTWNCEKKQEIDNIFKMAIVPGTQIKKEVEEKREMGYRDPDRLISLAEQGDETSSIALFEVAQMCPNLKAPVEKGWIRSEQKLCNRLEKDSLSQPLKLLESAIEKGSNYAKLAYAENSLAYIESLQQEKSANSLSIAESVIRKSQQYGREAAQAGVEEAYQLMVRVYYTGQFGKRDPTLAYAYLLPLLENNSRDDQISFAQKLKKELPKSEVDRAWQEAYGCNRAKDILQNPFNSRKEKFQ